MTDGPKYWRRAEMFLNFGTCDDVVIEQMITDDRRVSKEEVVTALKYAKSRGAGKEFEEVHKHCASDNS